MSSRSSVIDEHPTSPSRYEKVMLEPAEIATATDPRVDTPAGTRTCTAFPRLGGHNTESIPWGTWGTFRCDYNFFAFIL
jgi:hypothetical protein